MKTKTAAKTKAGRAGRSAPKNTRAASVPKGGPGARGGKPLKAASRVQQEDGLPAGMGAPATRALLGAGCERLEQVAALTEAEIAGLHGVGPKALGVLRSALEARGLSFSRTARD